MNPGAQAVLDFWFGAPGSPEHGSQRAEWFRKDPAFDARIAERFGPLIERALAGELRDWDADPASALARILLLDQFTRNTFRDTARAFAGDTLALLDRLEQKTRVSGNLEVGGQGRFQIGQDLTENRLNPWQRGSRHNR